MQLWPIVFLILHFLRTFSFQVPYPPHFFVFSFSFSFIKLKVWTNGSFFSSRYGDLACSRPKAGESLANTSGNFASWTKSHSWGSVALVTWSKNGLKCQHCWSKQKFPHGLQWSWSFGITELSGQGRTFYGPGQNHWWSWPWEPVLCHCCVTAHSWSSPALQQIERVAWGGFDCL